MRELARRVLGVGGRVLRPLERRRPPISTTVSPIFVVGCSHSGTTIVTALLNNHPRICSLPTETKIMERFRTRRAHERWLRHAQQTMEGAGKQRFCEKTPNHVFHLERVLGCYPKARVVVVQRDGRDVAASLAKRWNGHVARAARKWTAAIEAARPFRSDERVTTVVYEEFVQDPERVMGAVCEHIGEPATGPLHEDREQWAINYEGPIEATTDVSGRHEQHRAWQVNQPIFDGRGRWRDELTEAEQQTVERIEGQLLDELGYTR
jgi:hypothetical protein